MFKILVVGGTGFIGENVIKYASSLNWIIYSLSLHQKGLASKYQNLYEIKCDVNDLKNLKKKISNIEFDYVVNCLGYVDHSSFYHGGINVIQTHFLGTLNLIFTLNKKNLKKFINIGSSDEYGKNISPQNEKMIPNPLSCYSLSKSCISEFLKMMYINENFPSVHLRPFLTYGPGQNRNRLIPQIIDGCINKSKFPVSEGYQIRDFCYISDLVEAIFMAIDSDIINAEIINIGSGDPIEVKDVIIIIKELIGKGSPVFGKIPLRKNENLSLYANIDNAKRLLNWYPKINLEQGLELTINSFK